MEASPPFLSVRDHNRTINFFSFNEIKIIRLISFSNLSIWKRISTAEENRILPAAIEVRFPKTTFGCNGVQISDVFTNSRSEKRILIATTKVIFTKRILITIENEILSLQNLHTKLHRNQNAFYHLIYSLFVFSIQGKTTLLASISQRFRGSLTGKILLNGNEIDRKTMTNISCFVPQFDVTVDVLTPTEHLNFMAALRLDHKWSASRKKQRVDFLLRELSLLNVANNRISTLSGGERKKLNLACDVR